MKRGLFIFIGLLIVSGIVLAAETNLQSTKVLEGLKNQIGLAGNFLFTRYEDATAPGTPAAGLGVMYVEGKVAKFKDEDGTVSSMIAGAAGGFADPMTTRGDIIIRDSGNSTARLGIGGSGEVLKSDGTDISWGAAAGGGDVSKVGTPVDNQVGVWTGDGTIEGTSALVFDGTNLGIGTSTPSTALHVFGTSTMAGSLDMVDNEITDVGFIDMNLTNGVAAAEGRIVWNDTDGTINVGLKGGNVNLQVGQEQVLRVKNTSGSPINDGQVVRLTGATGVNPTIGLSEADVFATSGVTGLATEDIANNGFGYITTFGLVRDIDTTGTAESETWAAGDLLFLSNTAGAMTKVVPTSNERKVFLAVVIVANATTGILWVSPINTSFLKELSGNNFSTETQFDHIEFDGTVWANTSDLTVVGTSTVKTMVRSPETDQAIGTDTATISSASSHVQLNPSTDFVMVSTPTIAAGTEGQCIVLENVGTSTIDLQDDSVLSGSDVFLGRAESTLVGGGVMNLFYSDSDGGGWRVLSNPNTASLGADATLLEVRNETGSTLSAGVPVYVSGYNVGQGRPLIALADADGSGTMPAIGIVSVAITTGSNGEVITAGSANNIIDTSGKTINDPVYVGTTAGVLVFVKPTGASAKIQRIGTVARVHANSGVVLVTGAGRQNDEENLADANIFIGDSNGNVSNVAMSSEATIDNTGAVTIAGTHSGSAHHAAVTVNAPITIATQDISITVAKDLVSGNGLTGGEDNVFTGADADLTLNIELKDNAENGVGSANSVSGLEFESAELTLLQGCADNQILKWDEGTDTWVCEADADSGGAPEGTAVLSTGETGTLKFLRVDGDDSSSWNVIPPASVTVAGISELAITAEIDTGTDSTRAMPVDQFVASKRNIRWLVFNLVEAATDVAAATNIAGDFLSPIAGTILQSDTTPFFLYATNSTAGTTGTMVVDISIGGTTIMTTNKLDFDSTEKTTTTAATPPDLTTTSLAVGDIITIDIDAKHTTAAKGLTVYMAIRE